MLSIFGQLLLCTLSAHSALNTLPQTHSKPEIKRAISKTSRAYKILKKTADKLSKKMYSFLIVSYTFSQNPCTFLICLSMSNRCFIRTSQNLHWNSGCFPHSYFLCRFNVVLVRYDLPQRQGYFCWTRTELSHWCLKSKYLLERYSESTEKRRKSGSSSQLPITLN